MKACISGEEGVSGYEFLTLKNQENYSHKPNLSYNPIVSLVLNRGRNASPELWLHFYFFIHIIMDTDSVTDTDSVMDTGSIKKLLNGFGFISREGSDDLFFHSEDLVEGLSFDSLNEGDAVQFKEGSGPKGPKATEVSLVTAE